MNRLHTSIYGIVGSTYCCNIQALYHRVAKGTSEARSQNFSPVVVRSDGTRKCLLLFMLPPIVSSQHTRTYQSRQSKLQSVAVAPVFSTAPKRSRKHQPTNTHTYTLAHPGKKQQPKQTHIAKISMYQRCACVSIIFFGFYLLDGFLSLMIRRDDNIDYLLIRGIGLFYYIYSLL